MTSGVEINSATCSLGGDKGESQNKLDSIGKMMIKRCSEVILDQLTFSI